MWSKFFRASRLQNALLLHIPSIQALLIQTISFALVLGVAVTWSWLVSRQFALGGAVLLQGLLAALISRCCGQAAWWPPIQFIFPIALISLHALHLPPWIFLVTFIFLVVLYWSTFLTQVPFYPSTYIVWNVLAKVIPAGRSVRCIDIGSGFGGLVLHLAEQGSRSIWTGIELAPLPYFVSKFRARIRDSRAYFIRGDYRQIDFAQYDVVFAYLSPAAMPMLWQKAKAQMRPGTLLLSYEFLIPDVSPDIVENCGAPTRFLYGWYL